jgi:hypothetical protein
MDGGIQNRLSVVLKAAFQPDAGGGFCGFEAIKAIKQLRSCSFREVNQQSDDAIPGSSKFSTRSAWTSGAWSSSPFMRISSLATMVVRPGAVGELALSRPPVVAVAVNAVNGVALMTAMTLALLPMFTPALVLVLAILFGPLIAFAISSLYARIEWTVGRRLGGQTCLEDIYRIFAWSCLPLGFAALLARIILLALDEPDLTTAFAVSIPALIIALLAVRTYCANLVRAQQFSRVKGGVSLVLTLVLFLIVIAGLACILMLFFRYGAGDFLQTVLSLNGMM